MWRSQTLITRWRMQTEQSTHWWKVGRFVWIICLFTILFHSLSKPPRSTHAVPWVIASVMGVIGDGIVALVPAAGKSVEQWSVGWQGKRYEPTSLARYLDRQFYEGAHLGRWLAWAAVMGMIPVGVVGLVFGWWLGRDGDEEVHIRGAELVPEKELRRRLRTATGIAVAGVAIPQEMEQRHIKLCGTTGSGKSTAMRHLLRQIRARGETAFVVDPDTELFSEFYAPARGDGLFNPMDRRSIQWGPWSEGVRDEDLIRVAAGLFPIWDGMNGAAQYYHTVARREFRKVLAMVPDRDPRKIPRVLEEVVKQRQLSIEKAALSTLQNGCDPFRYLEPGGRPWSAKEWIRNPEGWVFLTSREGDRMALQPLMSLVFELVTSELLNRQIGAENPIWVVIDELAVLKALSSVAELLSRARKRNVRVVIGFQDKERLEAICGQAMTNAILNMPSTSLYMMTNDVATQKWCADNIGEREMQRPVESEAAGPGSTQDRVTRSHQRRGESAVMASQMGQLQVGEGYLRVAHYGTAKVTVPPAGRVEAHPAFLERAGAQVVVTGPSERWVVTPRKRTL